MTPGGLLIGFTVLLLVSVCVVAFQVAFPETAAPIRYHNSEASRMSSLESEVNRSAEGEPIRPHAGRVCRIIRRMAGYSIEGQDLAVVMNGLERLGALRRAVRVPVSSVQAVRVSTSPWSELRGIRFPGTGFPGVIALGTWRGRFGRDFAAIYGRRAAVVVELQGAEFSRLIVSCAGAEAVAAGLSGNLTLALNPTA